MPLVFESAAVIRDSFSRATRDGFAYGCRVIGFGSPARGCPLEGCPE
jgi:hypothetical protein